MWALPSNMTFYASNIFSMSCSMQYCTKTCWNLVHYHLSVPKTNWYPKRWRLRPVHQEGLVTPSIILYETNQTRKFERPGTISNYIFDHKPWKLLPGRNKNGWCWCMPHLLTEHFVSFTERYVDTKNFRLQAPFCEKFL